MPLPAIWLRQSSMPSGISVIKLLCIIALRIIGQLFNTSPMTSQPDSLWTFPRLPENVFCTLWCHDSISKVAKQWLVLCGDFNSVFDRGLDRSGSDPPDSLRDSSAALSRLFDACCVVDVWRFLYLTGRSLSWFRPDRSFPSRIDLVGLPLSWIPLVSSCHIIPSLL